MPVRVAFDGTSTTADFVDALEFAYQNGAHIISNSWGYSNSCNSPNLVPAMVTVIQDALNAGSQVLFAAGNTANHAVNSNGCVVFPGNANIDNLITVGASDRNDNQANYSPTDVEFEIAAPSHKAYNSQIPGEAFDVWTIDIPADFGYNKWRDSWSSPLPAVGEELPNTGTNYLSYTGRMGGTSAATPEVAAVAALMLSVNPCLTPLQIKDILQNTTDKVGGYNYNWDTNKPGHSKELGYGRVNAFKAVKLASDMYKAGIDLFSKDGQTGDDFGIEPYAGTGLIYLSTDIWVRNQADGIANQTSENPEHSSTNDPDQRNYVYVRVRNKGCVVSTGTETLDLRWAKASTSLSWPTNWNGTLDLDPPNNAIAGDTISTQTIPIIQPGVETILEFTWNPPNPADYGGFNNTEPQHFCLLSRILSSNDPMTFTETSDLAANVRNNNNIAWKNLAVVDNIADKIGGVCPAELINGIGVAVAVRNPDNKSSTYDIKFSVPQEELTNPITQEGKVMLALDSQLYEKWVQGGKKGTGFNEILSPPMSANGANNNQINTHSPIVISNRKMFEATGTTTQFNNITLHAGESRTTAMMVTYPTNPVSTKQNFKYDIIQKRSDNGEFIGGVRYDIRKPVNDDPPTDAGNNVTIKRGCNTTLTASPQNDCYVYFWLNQQGNIISRQPSITVSPNNTTTYTVKIVSSKGFVSNANVTVTVSNQLCQEEKDREIIEISPNPSRDRVLVKYRAKNTNVAHLRLVKMDKSIDKIYQLNLQMTETTLNISNFTRGSYVITLVCDGVNADSKTLIKH